MTDECRPKCYLCHEGFDDIEALREHQKTVHGNTESQSREPAPGDVTVF